MAKKKRRTTKKKKAAFRKELEKQKLLTKMAKNTSVCRVCQKPCIPPFAMHQECAYKAFYEDMLQIFMKYFPWMLMGAAMPIGAGLIARLAKEKNAKPKKGRPKKKR